MKTLTFRDSLASIALLVSGTVVHAAALDHFNLGNVTPMITSGAAPDSPDAHVDANTADSPFSGVVSLNIRYDNQSYICSGTLVGKRQVVTAGHCVDTDGAGHIIDVSQPYALSGKDVRVVFNAGAANGGNAVITASAVSMNPDYKGFGVCPAGVNPGGQCLNDDVAVVTLSQDAPASAKIYKVAIGPVDMGQQITMVGYGTSGDGVNGFYIDPAFRVKRSGMNIMDLFDLDDEQNYASGKKEVWYADFDGGGQDSFCTWGLACTPTLANDQESGIGGGDSGGSTFVLSNGEYMLLGNNTFGSGYLAGKFGSYFGGMMMSAYTDYLRQATAGNITFVPEPASLPLVLTSLGLVGVMARRRRSK